MPSHGHTRQPATYSPQCGCAGCIDYYAIYTQLSRELSPAERAVLAVKATDTRLRLDARANTLPDAHETMGRAA